MPLKITDFVEQVEGVTVEDIPAETRERINDALAERTGGPGGGGEAGPVNEDAILVSKSLNGRAGFTSIQDAIDGENSQNGASGADAGDTIFVESGTYDETVTAELDNLTIRAVTSGEPRVEGQVIATGNGVTVDGLRVSPPDPGDTRGADEAIRVAGGANDVTIVDNVVEDFARNSGTRFTGVDGINVFGGSGDDDIKNATIKDNLVRRLQNTGGPKTEFPGGAAGISIQGNVTNPTVEGNLVRDIGQEVTNFGFGIVVRGTGNPTEETPTDVTIKNNGVRNVLSDPESPTVGVGVGLEAGKAEDVTFSSNSIRNATFLLEDKTATIDLRSFANDNQLNRGALLENGDFEGVPGGAPVRNVIFDSIQLALDFVPAVSTEDTEMSTDDIDSPFADVPIVEVIDGASAYDPVTIDKPLILESFDDRPTIDASGSNPGIAIEASFTVVDGFEITGDDSTVAGISVRTSKGATNDVVIVDNLIRNITGAGGGGDVGVSFGILSFGDQRLTRLFVAGNVVENIGRVNAPDVDGQDGVPGFGMQLEEIGPPTGDSTGPAFGAIVDSNTVQNMRGTATDSDDNEITNYGIGIQPLDDNSVPGEDFPAAAEVVDNTIQNAAVGIVGGDTGFPSDTYEEENAFTDVDDKIRGLSNLS